MHTRRILGGLLGVLAVGGLAIWGVAATRPAPVEAKTSQAVTWYHQWQKAYVGGKTQKYVRANNGQGATQAFSEGQGYGMLASVLAAKRGTNTHATFNQFYRYYRAYRISAAKPLMQWRQTSRQGKMTSVGSERNSATDGDLDIAYALILADKRWGSKQVNYRRAAKQLLTAIKRYEINPTTKLPLMGSWATNEYDQSKVRTTDLTVGYFKAFASYTHDASWKTVATRSQRLVQRLSARHKTGLFPDFIRVSGASLKLTTVKPNEIESATDNQYGYNACRVPWRLAQTYRLTKDKTTKRALQKQLTFFKKQQRLTAGYTLGGKAVNTYTNTAFTAPAYLAAKTLKQTTLQRRLGKQLPRTVEKRNYFSATLQVVTALE